MSQSHDLVDSLPDLVILLRRDGVILAHAGGRELRELRLAPDAVGKRLDALWPQARADLARELARRAIAARRSAESQWTEGGVGYDLRVTPRSPDRVICVLRASPRDDRLERFVDGGSGSSASSEQSAFWQQIEQTLLVASLHERPVALVVIHLSGLVEAGSVFDPSLVDQLTTMAIRRTLDRVTVADAPGWSLGKLGETLLGLVIEAADRDVIEALALQICQHLQEPVTIREASFQLATHVGVAILAQDASTPSALLEQARAASAEAQHAGSARIHFFSDTLTVRALSRFDMARELRDAIANREIRLRYRGRYDLATGRLVTLVGYLQWLHPLRGEVRPAEFLSAAQATGMSAKLSQSVLASLRDDFVRFEPCIEPEVRISFGALRHHLVGKQFLEDIRELLADRAIPPERLELRIGERSFLAVDREVWTSLRVLGVQLVVDELGAKLSSLELLARAPLSGLQIDQFWIRDLERNPVAVKVCRAAVSVAIEFGYTPIATAVDDLDKRDKLLGLGFRQGLGEFYADFDAALLAH